MYAPTRMVAARADVAIWDVGEGEPVPLPDHAVTVHLLAGVGHWLDLEAPATVHRIIRSALTA